MATAGQLLRFTDNNPTSLYNLVEKNNIYDQSN